MEQDSLHDYLANAEVMPMQEEARKKATDLEYRMALNINSKPATWRKMNIMCTIAPCSHDAQVLERLILSGLTIARLNFSFNTMEWHRETLRLIRETEASLADRMGCNRGLAIAVDLRGPEIRTGALDGDIDVPIKKGDAIKLTTDKAYLTKGNSNTVYINYENILKFIQPEDRIYINDGLIPLSVNGIQGSNALCSVEADGILQSNRRVLMPGIINDLPSLSHVDRDNIAFCIAERVDYILLSFVRHADDVTAVRRALGKEMVLIIAKFETLTSVRNMEQIIDAADGCLINREMLSVEMPAEKVFLIQKSIIAKCNAKGKLVMILKQLLPEQMLPSGVPPTADFNDVANAVLDGIDVIQLPDPGNANFLISSIKLVSQACHEAEAAIFARPRLAELTSTMQMNDLRDVFAITAVATAVRVQAAAIVIFTSTGLTVQALSKYRSDVPIIAMAANARLASQLIFYRGVRSFYISGAYDATMNWMDFVEEQLKHGVLLGKIFEIVRSGDPIIFLQATIPGNVPDILRIEYISDIVTPINY